ncbi:hypothetical protein QSH57_015583 [Fusarium oxysporum f. sp. vasinfectum]|nr:hypothetical protein QSH57_015583 [Fusarium oxysporum f. sp. vasinfectum]
MIATLLVVIAILTAVHALIQSTISLCTARKRERPAAWRFDAIIGSPETDTESPALFVGPKDQTADFMDENLVSNIKDASVTNKRDAQAVSVGLFDQTATWAKLLDECRRMESDSQDWEKLSWRVHHGTNRPDIQGNAALTVVVQRNSGKPPPSRCSKMPRTTFAITTIRDVVELAAFFGLHWINFDSHEGFYAAGNGLTLAGVREKGIGFVFQFQRTGPGLSAKRIIPALEIRELCFGAIPTFYRTVEMDETYSVPLDTPASLETLRLGTRDKVTETLFTIGCNRRSIRAYLEKEKDILLFPGR